MGMFANEEEKKSSFFFVSIQKLTQQMAERSSDKATQSLADTISNHIYF